jgi:hypothetical protein
VSGRAPKSHMMAVGYANVGQTHRPIVGLKETLAGTTVRHMIYAGRLLLSCPYARRTLRAIYGPSGCDSMFACMPQRH